MWGSPEQYVGAELGVRAGEGRPERDYAGPQAGREVLHAPGGAHAEQAAQHQAQVESGVNCTVRFAAC